jgi:hypothetical protein
VRIFAWTATLAVTLAAWIAAGPFMTLHAIERAADRNDSGLLARNVDFEELRRNLKPQVRPLVDERLDRESEKRPWAALGKRYSGQIADGAVDALITPNGMARLLHREGHKKKKGKNRKNDGGNSRNEVREPAQKEWHFNSPSEFVLDVEKDGKTTSLVLSREGLVWKLTNIVLPQKQVRQ